MIEAALYLLAMSFAASTQSAEPLLDNEHVTVRDTAEVLPPSAHDYVAVSLSRKGIATFGHQGTKPGRTALRTIVIELKDLPVIPLANQSGYPRAFPRKHAKKLLENAQVIVWDYSWRPGEPTPMHFHDKDAVVVYEEAGALKSTTPDGKSVVTDFAFGQVRFSPRGRSHSEILAGGKARAVVTELK